MQQQDIGRFLIAFGALSLIIGIFFLYSHRLPLGKLPGDIGVGRGDVHFIIPVTTIVLLAIAVTLVLNFVSE